MHIGVLHPGEMGVSIAAALVRNGQAVSWARDERGPATVARALSAGLGDGVPFRVLAREVECIVSVCPPHAALDIAHAVAGAGFGGLYVDANAIAPATARSVAAVVTAGGADFVDGGIVGPPAERSGTTRLYLSGASAGRVAMLFDGTPVDARVIDGEAGAASALKVCYAAWTKGTSALLLAIRALARAERVEGALLDEWSISQRGVAERSAATAASSARKAWRWVGEMEEIAQSMDDAGLPAGFHQAAARIYAHLDAFKDARDVSLDDVLAALARREK